MPRHAPLDPPPAETRKLRTRPRTQANSLIAATPSGNTATEGCSYGVRSERSREAADIRAVPTPPPHPGNHRFCGSRMVLGTVLVCAAVGLLGLVGVTFAQYSNETFQVTIGDADDWPGATGLAYRYVDSIPSRAAGGAAGGWVVGGWAQHASAVARVAENGTVLWSHKLQFYEDGVPNSQTVVQCVAAMVDSGVVVAGYSYHLTPSESQAFVARLDDTGTTVFSHVVSYGGDTDQLRITACAAAADGGVMLMGEAPLGI